ncbi:methionine ABC transporter substrate-binding protein, partial [Escherichia coli]
MRLPAAKPTRRPFSRAGGVLSQPVEESPPVMLKKALSAIAIATL